MNTLRAAAHQYLTMRRHRGFKLHGAGRELLDFVTFMERQRAPVITQALAVSWAHQPVNVRPSRWAT